MIICNRKSNNFQVQRSMYKNIFLYHTTEHNESFTLHNHNNDLRIRPLKVLCRLHSWPDFDHAMTLTYVFWIPSLSVSSTWLRLYPNQQLPLLELAAPLAFDSPPAFCEELGFCYLGWR